MKFSKSEQEKIKEICKWSKTSDKFLGISHYLSSYGLQDGIGIFSFPNESLVLCFDTEIFDEAKFYPNCGSAINKTVLSLNLILKLERLGYITLVPEKGVEYLYAFHGNGTSLYINNIVKEHSDYEFDFFSNNVGKTRAKLKINNNIIIDTQTNKLIYFCTPVHFEFDSYRLLSSFMMVNQELFDLVSNNFKTYEDIQLEEAQKQTKSAYASLEEARKQSESAKFQTGLSIGAVLLSIGAIIASIIVPRVTPSTIDYSQFDSIQIKQNELINTLKELKTIQITNDSMIKELNLANQSIDEISNTLKEVKELNSKRK